MKNTSDSAVNCFVFRESTTEYMERALAPSMAQEMDRHLGECRDCRDFFNQVQLTVDALGALNREKTAGQFPTRILDTFRAWRDSAAKRELNELEGLLQDLLDTPVEERVPAVGSIRRFQSIELGEYALGEAARMSVRDPLQARDLAKVAVVVLRKVARSGPEDKADANDRLSRAWAVLGNCRKICSDFLGAAEAFQRSEAALACGSKAPEHRAFLLQIKAQFLADRGRLTEAVEVLDGAVSIYRDLGDSHNEGRTLIGKGKVLGSSGYVEEAIPCLKTGLDLIDSEKDLRLRLVAKHNLVQYLSESGRRKEALRMLPEARVLHGQLSNEVDLVRFQWLEGKIVLDLEDLEAAEKAFVEVKSYFVEHEMAYDAALVSLDLALVYLKQARTTELKNLASEMVTIFKALGIRREILAATAFFNRAQQIEQTATMGLMQDLIDALEKVRQSEDFRPHLSVSN